MTVLKERVVFTGPRKSVEAVATFDTGANLTFIAKDMADDLGIQYALEREVTLGDGSKAKVGLGLVQVEVQGCQAPVPVAVLQSLVEPIIGADTLQRFKAKLDMEAEKVIVERCPPRELRL